MERKRDMTYMGHGQADERRIAAGGGGGLSCLMLKDLLKEEKR
jgi:hypothetical protein